jgi:hypothetical protein
MKRLSVLLFLGLFLVPFNSKSQISTSIQPQKRIALVIGDGNYQASTLANPENDARAMKVALQSVGFTVFEYENLNQSQMKKAIDDFGMKLKGNDVGLFFYAGHGIQSKGYNYLIPVDAQLQTEQDVEYDCVQADRILAKMEGSGTKVNIIILDACRNNPFERSWTRSETGKGLAFMNAPSGTLIAYATSPGNTASDGSGNNGLYTSAILESIKIPNRTAIQMFQNVRNIVKLKSNEQQIPWESTSLTGDFYFKLEDSSEIDNKEFNRFNKSTVFISKNAEPRDETNNFNSIQKDYIWSILSIISYVKSYTEKAYTTENKFGKWNQISQVYLTKVVFDEDGLVKEIEDYYPERKINDSESNNKNDKLFGKSIYQLVNRDSICVVKYNSSGSQYDKHYIYFINDTTVLVEKDKFILEKSKLARMVDPSGSNLKKMWIYNENGLVSTIKKGSNRKNEVVSRFEYLEYDKYGNWTRRLEYGATSEPDYLVIREYKY